MHTWCEWTFLVCFYEPRFDYAAPACCIGDLGCGVLRFVVFFFFQAEDGIRDLVRSRGLGDVYKRQGRHYSLVEYHGAPDAERVVVLMGSGAGAVAEVVDLSLIHI